MAEATEGLQAATFGLRNYTLALVGVAVVSAFLSGLTWWDIHSGGADTHTLAEAAAKQATAAERQADVLRANMREDNITVHPIGPNEKLIAGPGEQLIGWDVNPVWTNVGGTDAKNVVAWWKLTPVQIDVRLKPIKPECPRLEEPAPRPDPVIMAPGGRLLQLASRLSVQDALRSIGPTADVIIYVAGHMEYRDIFPHSDLHYLDWCVIMAPNDIPQGAFSYLSVYQNGD